MKWNKCQIRSWKDVANRGSKPHLGAAGALSHSQYLPNATPHLLLSSGPPSDQPAQLSNYYSSYKCYIFCHLIYEISNYTHTAPLFVAMIIRYHSINDPFLKRIRGAADPLGPEDLHPLCLAVQTWQGGPRRMELRWPARRSSCAPKEIPHLIQLIQPNSIIFHTYDFI